MNNQELHPKDFYTTKYDAEFDQDTFRWFPWIGKNYDAHRILILGERHHGCWNWDGKDLSKIPKNSEEYKKEIQGTIDHVDDDKEFTRKVTFEHGITDECGGAVSLRNFNKTLDANDENKEYEEPTFTEEEWLKECEARTAAKKLVAAKKESTKKRVVS